MADKHYIWKGPATGIEVWSEKPGQEAATLLFSGQVAPGKPIGMALPESHSQIEGWLAFRLIEETEPATSAAPVDGRITADTTKKKDRTDG